MVNVHVAPAGVQGATIPRIVEKPLIQCSPQDMFPLLRQGRDLLNVCLLGPLMGMSRCPYLIISIAACTLSENNVVTLSGNINIAPMAVIYNLHDGCSPCKQIHDASYRIPAGDRPPPPAIESWNVRCHIGESFAFPDRSDPNLKIRIGGKLDIRLEVLQLAFWIFLDKFVSGPSPQVFI